MVPINKLAKNFLQDSLSQSLYPILIRDWGKIFGKLKNKIRLERAYKHTIVLGVTDSSWMHEMHLLSNILIDKINNHLEKPLVKHIKLQISEPKRKKPQPVKNKVELKTVKVSSKETLALKNISDKELAKELENFLIKCKQQ
jgi:hypothetical protein